MTLLWLSTESLRERDLHAYVPILEAAEGLHVDVYPSDSVEFVLEHVERLHAQARPRAMDVHFIDDRGDSALVVEALRRRHRIRTIYSPRRNSTWALAGTASEYDAGVLDAALVGQTRVLVTAPPATRPHEYRAGIVERAVRRIVEVAGGGVAMVLDRDVDAELAQIASSPRVAEIVVGKAILGAPDVAAAARRVKEAWGAER